jgi:hypothetical protein
MPLPSLGCAGARLRRLAACRRHAAGGQVQAGLRHQRGRPDVDLGAQVRRPQGRGRAADAQGPDAAGRCCRAARSATAAAAPRTCPPSPASPPPAVRPPSRWRRTWHMQAAAPAARSRPAARAAGAARLWQRRRTPAQHRVPARSVSWTPNVCCTCWNVPASWPRRAPPARLAARSRRTCCWRWVKAGPCAHGPRCACRWAPHHHRRHRPRVAAAQRVLGPLLATRVPNPSPPDPSTPRPHESHDPQDLHRRPVGLRAEEGPGRARRRAGARGLWGGTITLANGWLLALPEMAADTTAADHRRSPPPGRWGLRWTPPPSTEALALADAAGSVRDAAPALRCSLCAAARGRRRRTGHARRDPAAAAARAASCTSAPATAIAGRHRDLAKAAGLFVADRN